MREPDISAPFEYSAVLIDAENVLLREQRGPRELVLPDLPSQLRDLTALCKATLLRHDIVPLDGWCSVCLQHWYSQSKDWHDKCEAAANGNGFKLHWSPLGQPADTMLSLEVNRIIASRSTLPRTLSVYIFSGDGDYILDVDKLIAEAKCNVCMIGWRQSMSPYYQLVASGVVDLDELITFRRGHMVITRAALSL